LAYEDDLHDKKPTALSMVILNNSSSSSCSGGKQRHINISSRTFLIHRVLPIHKIFIAQKKRKQSSA
jgi:hypothetical protein